MNYEKRNLTCNELQITKKYWKKSVFSFTAKIPNNQVTPRTGSNTPRDRKLDLFEQMNNFC